MLETINIIVCDYKAGTLYFFRHGARFSLARAITVTYDYHTSSATRLNPLFRNAQEVKTFQKNRLIISKLPHWLKTYASKLRAVFVNAEGVDIVRYLPFRRHWQNGKSP